MFENNSQKNKPNRHRSNIIGIQTYKKEPLRIKKIDSGSDQRGSCNFFHTLIFFIFWISENQETVHSSRRMGTCSSETSSKSSSLEKFRHRSALDWKWKRHICRRESSCMNESFSSIVFYIRCLIVSILWLVTNDNFFLCRYGFPARVTFRSSLFVSSQLVITPIIVLVLH